VTYRQIEQYVYQKSLDTGEAFSLTGLEVIQMGIDRQVQGLKGWTQSINSDHYYPLPTAARRMHAQRWREKWPPPVDERGGPGTRGDQADWPPLDGLRHSLYSLDLPPAVDRSTAPDLDRGDGHGRV
jgi:hypothetical protein